MRWLATLKTNRKRRNHDRDMEDTLNEAFGRPSYRHIRRWNREELHRAIASKELHTVEQSMAEQLLRRKEEWDGPAGWSFRVSVAAFVVSLLAVAISILKAA